MNCPSCNKFAALEFQDIDEPDLEVTHEYDEETKTHTYTIGGELRIVRTSECCGDEMKEAILEVSSEVIISNDDLLAKLKPIDPEDGPDFDDCAAEITDCSQVEEGGGRYAKSYFGPSVTGRVTVGGVDIGAFDWTDKTAASSMDELV